MSSRDDMTDHARSEVVGPAGIDLRIGDGIAGLAELGDSSVDVCVTDPPFDARAHRAAIEQRDWRTGRRKIDGALPFAALPAAELGEVAAQLARVVRRWIVIFAAERQIEAWAQALEAAGARFVRIGFAMRNNPRPQMTGDRPAVAADLLVIAHADGEMQWNGGGRPARWISRAARFDPGGKVHPTQKSLPLIHALVEDFTDPGELVLDPFAGSGTTAVACREAGRSFLGWELEPGYHGAALKRIAATREQLRLDEVRPHEQAELW